MTVRRAACALVLGVAAAATFSGAASAAVSVTSFSVTPSTTQAGGHPNLVVDTSLASNPDTDDVKSLNVVLPQGLVGDPRSAGRCSQSAFTADACPADSKVGITTVTATLQTLGSSTDSPGDVYSLAPLGSEPARLGIIVRPALGPMSLQKLFLQSPVTVGPSTNFGLSTTFDNLPRQVSGFDIRTDRLKLTLFGQVAHGPFISNPTYCHSAIANTTITSYDAPGSSSASAGFTPTGCDRVPFAPLLQGSVVTTAGATPSKPVGVQTTIALPAGQANLRTAVVRLPRTLSSNTAVLSGACTLEQQASASGCPDSSRVGSARTVSPLLAAPLGGKVFLAATTTGLPKLLVVFTGALALKLDGNVDISNGVATTFDGLPDVPLSRFDLTLDRSSRLLTSDSDLCRPGGAVVASATLTAQSGRVLNINAPLPSVGCGRATKPKGSVSLSFRRGVGTLRASFAAGRGAGLLRKLRLGLPSGVTGPSGGRGLARVVVTAGGRRVAKRLLKLRGRTLAVDLGRRGGAITLNVRWIGLTPGASLARRLSSARTRRSLRLTFVPRLTDTTGRGTTLRLRVRPS
ncbi:MAG: hypothetical protein QOH11_2083 [Solirubrobacteraceae bacterium]|jgi:hypothetical protein|nr:hypothetical protein [Solirubrobacteraceae bacterium]